MISADAINLPPELEAIALAELGETKELRESSLIDLRNRIQYLPNALDRLVDLSDRSLIRFLRSRKYDVDKALENTICLQHFHNKYPEITSGVIHADHLKNLFKFLSVIHEPLPSGRVIMIMKPKEGIKHFDDEIKKK